MAIPFVAPIDMNRNEIQNLRVQNLASEPTQAVGLIYYNTGTKLLGVSDGTAWTYLDIAAATGGGLTTEDVQDILGAMGNGSTVVTATYNDAAGTIVWTIGAGQIVNSMVSNAAAISADKIADGTANKVYTAAEKTKLAGVATGATANDTDANLKNRANHTGTQVASTISDFATAVNALVTAKKVTDLAAPTTPVDFGGQRLTGLGTPSASTDASTKGYVDTAVSGLVNSAPGALDTLNELAAALGNDANFATTMTTALANKANISSLASVATAGTYASLNSKPRYTTSVGDGSATAYTITHALGTKDVKVTLYQTGAPYSEVMAQVDHSSTSVVTLTFGTAPTAGAYAVYITAV